MSVSSKNNNGPLRVALIGNPNTGKSTLFNALAGMNVRTGNYPGVTVEQKTAKLLWKAMSVELIDLPGTYSLSPRSADEMVPVNVLTGCDGAVAPDVVVCICNAAALERNLFLFTQVKEIGRPLVLCLNMWDTAQQAGITINLSELSRLLDVPVVTTCAVKRLGLVELQNAVFKAHKDYLAQSQSAKEPNSDVSVALEEEASASSAKASVDTIMPEPVRTVVAELSAWLGQSQCEPQLCTPFLVRRSLLDPGGSVEQMLSQATQGQYASQVALARTKLADSNIIIPDIEATQRYAFIKSVMTATTSGSAIRGRSMSDAIDGWLTHRIFGFVICMAVMLLMFSTIYWFSQPLSEMVENGLGWVSDQIVSSMSTGLLRSLVVDGVVAGV